MEKLRDGADLAGRILLAVIFLLSGVGKIGNWDGTAAHMAGHGMPLVPLFLLGAIVLEVSGGISLALGLKGRWGALALVVFLVPTTIIFHPVWADPAEKVSFMKNLAILGGLLVAAAHGPGSLSLDARMGGVRRWGGPR